MSGILQHAAKIAMRCIWHGGSLSKMNDKQSMTWVNDFPLPRDLWRYPDGEEQNPNKRGGNGSNKMESLTRVLEMSWRQRWKHVDKDKWVEDRFGVGKAASETALSGGLTQTDRAPPLRTTAASLFPFPFKKKVITCPPNSNRGAKTVSKLHGFAQTLLLLLLLLPYSKECGFVQTWQLILNQFFQILAENNVKLV